MAFTSLGGVVTIALVALVLAVSTTDLKLFEATKLAWISVGTLAAAAAIAASLLNRWVLRALGAFVLGAFGVAALVVICYKWGASTFELALALVVSVVIVGVTLAMMLSIRRPRWIDRRLVLLTRSRGDGLSKEAEHPLKEISLIAVGGVASFAALASLTTAYRQSELLNRQNALIDLQTRVQVNTDISRLLSSVEVRGDCATLTPAQWADFIGLAEALEPVPAGSKSPARGRMLVAMATLPICDSLLAPGQRPTSAYGSIPLGGATARSALLSGARLHQAQLSNTDLSRAIFDTLPTERHSDLSNADLSGALLVDAHLRYALLRDANLTGTNLSFADLEHAELQDVVLTNAKLVCSKLSNAEIEGAQLEGAHVEGADFTGARHLVPAQLQMAIGDGATKLPPGVPPPRSWDIQRYCNCRSIYEENAKVGPWREHMGEQCVID